MPKRIFIRDGGLTSSRPIPSGYVVLGSEGGQPKKQINNSISNFVVQPLQTFDLAGSNFSRNYDFSSGNYASISLSPRFNDVVLPSDVSNLESLSLISDYASMSVVQIDTSNLQNLTSLYINVPKNKLNLISNSLDNSILNSISLRWITSASYSILNTSCSIMDIKGNIDYLTIKNNSLLTQFTNDSYLNYCYFDNNPLLTTLNFVGTQSYGLSVSNCPSLLNFYGYRDNGFIESDMIGPEFDGNSTLTSFNLLVGVTSVRILSLWGHFNLSSVDITGMTGLKELYLSICSLNSSSIETILVNLDSYGQTDGLIDLRKKVGPGPGSPYGNNALFGTWTANAVTAYNNLIAKGWSVLKTN